MEDKIKQINELKDITDNLRNEGKIIVTTNGSFDILHYAHVNLLEKAKNEGDVLIVLLNSDSSIRKNKGEKRPIIHQDERAKMLAALKSVDYITIFEEDTPLKLLEVIKPNIHVKGGSFIPERMKEEENLLKRLGGKHKHFELEEGYSTTNIIQKIIDRIDFS